MEEIEQLDDDKLRKTIADNLVKYRKHAKLTQIEFAEKLLYSDKNVSRWERGESTPDIFVLQKIADLYGVTVNDLLEETEEIKEPVKKTKKSKLMNKKQLLITLLSVFCVWLVATIGFFVVESFIPSMQSKGWYCFIIALPFSVIVTLVFTSLWCTNLLKAIVVSFLIWSIATAIYICIPYEQNWLIFILAIPVQILDVLWFTLRKINANLRFENNTKKNKNNAKHKKEKKEKVSKDLDKDNQIVIDSEKEK